MKIVVIGGIAAGTSAVAKAKRLLKDEADCVIYEKGEMVSFGACGLPYFVGDFFSDQNEMIARSVEAFEKTGVKVKTHHEVFHVDFAERTLQVKNLLTGEIFTDTYDQLVIATGAKPFIPPFKNKELGNIISLRKMADGVELKTALANPKVKEVAIVGGGFIGLELVEAMKNLGKKVTVIQMEDRILSGTFDSEMTDLLETELKNNDVTLRLGEKVEGFTGTETVDGVVTDANTYPADLVILTTGVRPNTEFLKDSPLKFFPNGAIIADEYGRTNLPNVYAAGDCATVKHFVTGKDVYISLATMANKMGRIVGENLAGKNMAFKGALGSSGLKVLDCEVAGTGLTEEMAKAEGIDYGTVFIQDKNQTSYYPGQKDIYIKLVYLKDSKVLIGGQIAGEKGAVLRIDTLAAAISAKMTTEDLGFLDVVYAPPFARTWDALNVAGNVAK